MSWLICIGLVFIVAGSASAQNSKSKKLVRENRTLTTKDGWDIHVSYYKSPAGKESPVIVLLHGKGSNRLVWRSGFADRLQKEGYAVVAVDLRKHGESKSPTGDAAAADGGKKETKKGFDASDLKPTDYSLMVAQDLEAVKKFIQAEHQAEHLNMRKLAIVAPDMSVPIALTFAVRDWLKIPHPDGPTFAARTPRGQDVRALVLLSPEGNLPRLSGNRAIQQLKNPAWEVAFLICVGKKDKLDKGQSKRIDQQLTAITKNKDRVYFKEYTGNWRGTELLNRQKLVGQHMLGFFSKHLKALDSPWRDRRSRLSR